MTRSSARAQRPRRALVMIGRQHGIDTTVEAVRRRFVVQDGPIGNAALIALASEIGLQARALRVGWNDLPRLVEPVARHSAPGRWRGPWCSTPSSTTIRTSAGWAVVRDPSGQVEGPRAGRRSPVERRLGRRADPGQAPPRPQRPNPALRPGLAAGPGVARADHPEGYRHRIADVHALRDRAPVHRHHRAGPRDRLPVVLHAVCAGRRP